MAHLAKAPRQIKVTIMKRLLIIYNPRSSRYAEIEQEILSRARELSGYLVGKYEVANTNIDDNVRQLSKLLKDEDLVLSAGGDATAIIAANAVLNSKKQAILAVLPYGNFNDLARTLRTKTFDDVFLQDTAVRNLYPLEIIVDGNFYRYSTCYVTIGMMAESVGLYNEPKMRRKLKKKFGRSVSSYTQLASWYFKNRRNHIFLPEFKLNGALQPKKSSDYAAVNGRSMARVMKGGEDYRDPKYFRHKVDRLTSFYRLVILMSKSILSRIPGAATDGDILEFTNPSTITIQAEGESTTFKNVKTIEIRKGKQCLKVIEN